MINSWKGSEIKVSIAAVINQWGPATGRQTRGSPTHHSWLEMSKTSQGEASSHGFTLSVGTAAHRAVSMVSTFFSPITWGAGVQSEYNGPTLRPSSEKLRRPPSDMIAWARGNEWLLLSLPHFPAGCPVVGWRSVFCVFFTAVLGNSQSRIT